jgi:hypothetical protein
MLRVSSMGGLDPPTQNDGKTGSAGQACRWRMLGFGVLLFAVWLALTIDVNAGTVEDIRSSGAVTCGVDENWPGHSVRAVDYTWAGLNVDLCRALAAAVLGNGQNANLTIVSTDEMIVALQSGEIDVLLHRLPWTQGADVRHGVMFVTPTFFDEAVAYGPLVRQGDDQWFHVVRSVVQALITPPADRDPAIDAALLLEPGWQERAIGAAGRYDELIAKHFGDQVSPKDLPVFAPP